MKFVARDGKMVGTQYNVEDRYAQVPYQGDFAASRRVGCVDGCAVNRRTGALSAFVQVAGEILKACIDGDGCHYFAWPELSRQLERANQIEAR